MKTYLENPTKQTVAMLFTMLVFVFWGEDKAHAYSIHPPEHYEHYYALLVGADNWANEPSGVKDGLLQWYNWNAIGTIEYITNPSNTGLLDKINEYAGKVGANDFFLFWYSGHGAYDKEVPFRQNEQVAAGKALDKYDEALWGSSSGVDVYDDQLAASDFLGGIKGDMLAVFASCFSGGMWGGNDEGDLEKLTHLAVYASSTELQTTAGTSTFVTGLIDGLTGKKADANKDLHLTIGEWYDYGDSKNQGELVATLKPDGTWGDKTKVDPQYFDNPVMKAKYVAYDNVPEPSTMILFVSGLLTILTASRRIRR